MWDLAESGKHEKWSAYITPRPSSEGRQEEMQEGNRLAQLKNWENRITKKDNLRRFCFKCRTQTSDEAQSAG
jgi:hypothetical protein